MIGVVHFRICMLNIYMERIVLGYYCDFLKLLQKSMILRHHKTNMPPIPVVFYIWLLLIISNSRGFVFLQFSEGLGTSAILAQLCYFPSSFEGSLGAPYSGPLVQFT